MKQAERQGRKWKKKGSRYIRLYIIRIGAQHATNKVEEWASSATVVEFDYVTLNFSPFAYVNSRLRRALDTQCCMSMTFGTRRDAVSIEVVVLGFEKIML